MIKIRPEHTMRLANAGVFLILLVIFSPLYMYGQQDREKNKQDHQDQEQAKNKQDDRGQDQDKGRQEQRQQVQTKDQNDREQQDKGQHEQRQQQVNDQKNNQQHEKNKQEQKQQVQVKNQTEQRQKQDKAQQDQRERVQVKAQSEQHQQDNNRQEQRQQVQVKNQAQEHHAEGLQKQQTRQASRDVRVVQRTEQRGMWQERRAGNWQSEHHSWQDRGGYNGYRIPRDHYHGFFGRSFAFRIYSSSFQIYDGFPRFRHNGYWFSILDPWPESWSDDWYENDDVYISYSNDGYYMYNRRHPGIGIAVSVSVN